MRIFYGSDANQFGDLSIPGGPGPHPTVAFVHGGFWRARFDLSHSAAACEALTKAGLATWNLEYRRIGQPGGGWPGTALDVLAGVKHLKALFRAYNLDPERVVITGHSAGGHLALWTAAQNPLPVRAAVSLAGVADVRGAWDLQLSSGVAGEFIGGSPEQFPAEYSAASPVELLPIATPQILIHGTADLIVPFSISERFARKSTNARLVPLDGAGHSEVIDPTSREWQTVLFHLTEALAL